MKTPKNSNLVRVNLNIPKEMLEKIEDIGNMKGLNRTQTILMALSNFIDTKESLDYMPKIIEIIKKEQQKEVKKLLKNK